MPNPETEWQEIRAAPMYHPADDLWVVTSFFNSNNYFSKHNNYQLFIDSLANSGIHYLVVECAFGDQLFSLPESPHILKVRSRSVLWQKERLLNVAVASLPPSCTKIAWIDCDVLFENPSWAVETSRLLETYTVVQPFDFVIRLPKGPPCYRGAGERSESFASVYRRNPGQLPAGDFASHGHTGFAWAIQRDVIAKHGFYDACITGCSDHKMSHAFCGDFFTACNTHLFADNEYAWQHFYSWAQTVYTEVAGRIGCLPGKLLHLWHGDMVNRQYYQRNKELAEINFNPYEDLSINEEGCWEWSHKGFAKSGLHAWAVAYHVSRKEDG